jgi:2-amino-4-hydroxy-6-hydroxymethyldihydropteridine diphosphokinase
VNLAAGLAGLEDRGAVTVRRSRIYRTDPVGGPPQGEFLNLVVEVETALGPAALLAAALEVERGRGRRREEEVRWGPRTLDIDILLFRGRVLSRPGLELPHPRLHLRRFVLAPLAELAPDLRHPRSGRTIAALLAACEDSGAVRPETPAPGTVA